MNYPKYNKEVVRMYMPKCGGCQKSMTMVQREGEFVEVKCRECGSHAFIWDEA